MVFSFSTTNQPETRQKNKPYTSFVHRVILIRQLFPGISRWFWILVEPPGNIKGIGILQISDG